MTMHDMGSLEHPEWYSRGYTAWYGLLHPRAARNARHVICVSEFTRRRVVEVLNVPESRTSVIYEGVDDVFRRPPESEIDSELEARSIRRPYLLAIGSISPRKNFDRLIDAWGSVAAKRAEGELVIVGRANLSFSRDGALRELPRRTRHLSDVDDPSLVRLLAGARGFVFPSLYEGFGLPVLEAMAVGTPVLTSNTTSLPEVAGDAALIVDPLNVDEIADGMRQLLDDDILCTDLRQRGDRRIQRFNWDDAARETWEILQAVSQA